MMIKKYILGGQSHVSDSLLSVVISKTNVETKSKKSPAENKQKHLYIYTFCNHVSSTYQLISVKTEYIIK